MDGGTRQAREHAATQQRNNVTTRQHGNTATRQHGNEPRQAGMNRQQAGTRPATSTTVGDDPYQGDAT
ncbi:hypothetical protein C7S16_4578 [Burkholderia thailandensis]|uniref:Uncharacterized protein n=1 Tax=Burkholderia thailandensis TaxID=57975 RepID=A0AAW9CRG9_BURTH|nr:hypothetical protein [Burkholderia thailandensis]